MPCSSCNSFTTEPIIVGTTPDFTLYVKKNGVVWNITGGDITLSLRKPDGTELGPYTATITSGTGGIAHYQVADTIIDVAGIWYQRWDIVVGSIHEKTSWDAFSVED